MRVLHIWAMLHMRVMLPMWAMLDMRSNVTYEGFLLLLFLEDNRIVYFCSLALSSDKSIVFDNSDCYGLNFQLFLFYFISSGCLFKNLYQSEVYPKGD